MSKSFFAGTDAEVYHGAAHFSAKINASPEVYGLDPETAAEFQVLADNYAAAYNAAITPSTRTRSSVAGKTNSKAALRKMASSLSKIIAGTGSVTDEQRIGLGLSVRDKPAPLPPPGKPDRFSMQLWQNGVLRLSWKCPNPRGSTGTMYRISRQIGNTGEFISLGTSGKKYFVDATLPAGASAILYRVQAIRSTAAGESTTFNVNFGGANLHPAMLANMNPLAA